MAFHHQMTRAKDDAFVRIEHQKRELARLVVEKSGCEQSDLDALQVRVRRNRILLGPADSWDQLVRLFGKRWKSEAGSRDDREGYSIQVGTFRLQAPTIWDWPHVIDSVSASENLPGIGVIGFEMKTSGDRERRSVDLVKVVVIIQSLRSNAFQISP
jgi:hypothetical protein